MKKSDFIKLIEDGGNASDIIKTLSDKEALNTTKETLNNLDSIQKKMEDLGITSENENTDEKIEENFVNSKIFTIIAESETPKISKHEILKFLNNRK